ncbi:hypothetical protein J1G42_03860 [Cellulomonas sp. zg-ZUI222]|uniref:hypothetical protein n=1 Tax=Cellulomonas wangleii TaxID=2816956 RepID=UPI001A944FB7|nr:hypothetical protein [Cellulomonas wangleii]MBO0919958.1 hypothetical protein [Cellulomonas wangleii]
MGAVLVACTAPVEHTVQQTLTVERATARPDAEAVVRVPDGTGRVVERPRGPATPPGAATHAAPATRARADTEGTPADATTTAAGLPRVLDRAWLQDTVTETLVCAGDDLVLTTSAVVEVVGTCGTLSVEGAGARVLAAGVGRLVVRGDGALVVVADVDEVVIEADGARVAWEDGTPRVDGPGADAGYGPVGVVRLDTRR